MSAPAPTGPLHATTDRWSDRYGRRRGATAVRFGDAPRVAIIPDGPNEAGRPMWVIRAEGDAVDYARTVSPARARALAIAYARFLAESLAGPDD